MPPRRKQQRDNGDITYVGGTVQRRVAVVVFRIHIRSRRKQRRDNG